MCIRDSATTEAVLHGHLGVVNEQTHETVSTEYYDFLKITDAKEYAVAVSYTHLAVKKLFCYGRQTFPHLGVQSEAKVTRESFIINFLRENRRTNDEENEENEENDEKHGM